MMKKDMKRLLKNLFNNINLKDIIMKKFLNCVYIVYCKNIVVYKQLRNVFRINLLLVVKKNLKTLLMRRMFLMKENYDINL